MHHSYYGLIRALLDGYTYAWYIICTSSAHHCREVEPVRAGAEAFAIAYVIVIMNATQHGKGEAR